MGTWTRWERSIVAGVAVLALGAVSGCSGDDDEDADEPPDGGSGQEAEVGTGSLVYDGPYTNKFVRQLNGYVHQRLRLSGTVHRVVSPDAFMIGGESVDELLIINVDRTAVSKGDKVHVTGRLFGQMDVAAVEARLGRDLDAPVIASWGKEPYLVAQRVAVTPGLVDSGL